MDENIIIQKLEELKRISLLSAKNVLTIDDVCLLTGLKRNYIYMLTSGKQIPHYHPTGKLIYFDRSEIEDWMKRNRVQTKQEAETKALAYVAQN